MVKTPYKHLAIFIGALVVLVFVGNIVLGLFLQSKKQEKTISTPTVAATPSTVTSDLFFYTGQTGKDALKLLKEKANIEQDRSGLVVAINGRKADSSKHEYWAFYVNGKLGNVGPAEYKTNDGDRIEWKIEAY